LILDSTVVERRLEMLKLEGNGLEPSEIVKDLSAKYGVSQRMIYKDFETRSDWQPPVQEMEKSLLKARNRHEQLYRKAIIAYAQAKTDGARLASLNLLRQINVELVELAGAKFQSVEDSEEISIKWEDPKVVKNSNDKV